MTKRSLILVVFAAIAALHLAALTNHWVPKQDSALYMVLGRSLAEGRGMEFAGRQEWGIPPFVPLLIAGCRLAVGPDPWLPNLIMTLFGLGTVALSYGLARRWAAELPPVYRQDLPIAVLILAGTSARLFVDSTHILTDVPFAFWVTLGLYGFVRGWQGHWAWCLAGSLALAVGVYTRLPAPAILLAAVVSVLIDRRRPGWGKRAAAALGGGALVLAGAALWLVLLGGRRDAGSIDYLASVRPDQLLSWEGLGDTWATVAEFPGAIVAAVIYQKLEWFHFSLVPTAFVVLGLVTSVRHRQWLAVLPLVAYFLVLAARGGGSAASRYMLPVMPILAYALLAGVQTLANWGTRLGRALGVPDSRTTVFLNRVPIAVAVALLTATGLFRVGRQILWIRHPQFEKVYEEGRWRDTLAVGRYLAARGQRSEDAVLTPDDTVVAYASGLRTEGLIAWQGRREEHWSDLPPEALLRAATGGEYRFVVVPADKGDWSRAVEKGMAESDLFMGPPRRFGRFALYERRRPPGDEPEPGGEDGGG